MTERDREQILECIRWLHDLHDCTAAVSVACRLAAEKIEWIEGRLVELIGEDSDAS